MPWRARVLARYVPAGHWCEFTKPDKETRNKRLSRKHQPVPGWTCAEAPAQPGLAYQRAAGNLTQRPNPPDTLALGTQAPAPPALFIRQPGSKGSASRRDRAAERRGLLPGLGSVSGVPQPADRRHLPPNAGEPAAAALEDPAQSPWRPPASSRTAAG